MIDYRIVLVLIGFSVRQDQVHPKQYIRPVVFWLCACRYAHKREALAMLGRTDFQSLIANCQGVTFKCLKLR